jgi:hypothetical protein
MIINQKGWYIMATNKKKPHTDFKGFVKELNALSVKYNIWFYSHRGMQLESGKVFRKEEKYTPVGYTITDTTEKDIRYVEAAKSVDS